MLTWLLNKIYLNKEILDVRRFNKKFRLPVHNVPGHHLDAKELEGRYQFLLEEVEEFKRAMEANDLAGQFDALIDIVYVAKGTAVMQGLPWEEGWNEVQRANMSKVRGTSRRFYIDVVKPQNWIPPQHEQILAVYGFKDGD